LELQLTARARERETASNNGIHELKTIGNQRQRIAPLFFFAGLLCLLAPGSALANAKLDAALCKAAPHASAATVRALVKKGANANALCEAFQATALQNATREGNLGAMTALLDAGADIDAWSGGDACCRETALGFAYDIAAARLLVARHANVSIRRPGDGYTPLIWLSMSVTMASTDASAGEDTEIGRMLIEAGAEVNASGSDGMTPLMIAVGPRSKAFVTLLLDKGADVNAKNDSGVTALDVAKNQENLAAPMGNDPQPLRDIESLLRARGAVE
jgi:ankyrin repeat protein